MKKAARSITNKKYSMVEINTPLCLIWDKEGKFKGVLAKPDKKATKYQKRLIKDFLDSITFVFEFLDSIHDAENKKTKIPDCYLKAFDDDEKSKA